MHSHLKIVRLPLLRVGRGEAPLPGRSCDFGRAWTFMPLLTSHVDQLIHNGDSVPGGAEFSVGAGAAYAF